MRFQIFLLLGMFSLPGIVAAQDANLPQGPQPDTNFSQGPQYVITGNVTFLHPVSTPTLSLDAALPAVPSLPEIGPVVTDQPYVSNPDLGHEANLFPIYYGYPMVSVVELTGEEPSQPLPASIGYTVVTDPQAVRELGYGIPVGEAASYWKAHKASVNHVYTNADIERLHRS
ncbi:MAG TPA: hypothetical protein VE866_02505 [Candidatus Binatia bacterium]|jgi:hypothetical protein|nr:hypothetical protein [Candidatus Binatia bacterium]